MTSYQKAIKALEECVKDAMENDIDPGLQMEIWRHYNGVQTIYEDCADDVPQIQFQQDLLTETPAGDYFFSPEAEGGWPSSSISLSSDTIAAAGPVNIDTNFGQDVITFS